MNGDRWARRTSSTPPSPATPGTIGGGIHAGAPQESRPAAAAPQDRADRATPVRRVQQHRGRQHRHRTPAAASAWRTTPGIQGERRPDQHDRRRQQRGHRQQGPVERHDRASPPSTAWWRRPARATVATDADAADDHRPGPAARRPWPTTAARPRPSCPPPPARRSTRAPPTPWTTSSATPRAPSIWRPANATGGDGTDVGAVEISSPPVPTDDHHPTAAPRHAERDSERLRPPRHQPGARRRARQPGRAQGPGGIQALRQARDDPDRPQGRAQLRVHPDDDGDRLEDRGLHRQRAQAGRRRLRHACATARGRAAPRRPR